MTPLRQRLLDELTRRNYSPRTVEAYLAGVLCFVRFTRRSPDQASADDLRRFQLHLIAQRVSWSRFNQITCALRFFFTHVLLQPHFVPFVVYARQPKNCQSYSAPTKCAVSWLPSPTTASTCC